MRQWFITQASVIAAVTLLFSCMNAAASVVISGTRIIYPAKEREVTVKLTNQGQEPVLIQSWIDNGDINANPDNIKVPFILTPPINRVNPQKSQTLRIGYVGNSLPADRESVFWINVLEIPQTKAKAAPNRLQVAFRSRIKFFYRPENLSGDAIDAARSLSLSVNNGYLLAANHSPYFISLASISVLHQGKKNVIEGEMIAPFSDRRFSFKSAVFTAGDTVTYEYINDWGAVKSQRTTL